MATKKTEPEVVEEQPAVEKPTSAWDEIVDVRVPRHRPGEEEQHYVCVNGIARLVELDGKLHHLERPIAEAMLIWMDGEEKVDEMLEHIPNDREINGIKVV